MADVKISALPSGTASGTDQVPAVQSATTKRMNAQDIGATAFNGVVDIAVVAEPSTPTAGTATPYFRNVSGRMMLKWMGDDGIDYIAQPSIMARTIVLWLPGVTTTAAIAFGVSWTINTTQAHPGIANTNFMTQIVRATFTTTTTAANTTGIRSAAAIAWRGNAAGQGGFHLAARFGILTYSSTMRVWVGLSGLTTAIAGDPSAQNDTICMSKDTGETTWQVLTRDTTAASKTSTGRTTAAAGAAEIFDFYAWCHPNDNQITVRVVDITSGTVLIDNVSKSSNLPTSTTMLTAHAEAQNVTGGAGTAVAIFLSKMYVEIKS